MTFGQAMDRIRNGVGAMRLQKWSKDLTISVQLPDETTDCTHNYFVVECNKGRAPWNPTQIELFATDWEVID